MGRKSEPVNTVLINIMYNVSIWNIYINIYIYILKMYFIRLNIYTFLKLFLSFSSHAVTYATLKLVSQVAV